VRAGLLDLFVETGTAWSRDVQVLRPGTPIEAQAVTPGMRVFVDNWPALVYSVSPVASGYVSLRFGTGLANDPTVTLEATAPVHPAEPAQLLEALAAYTLQFEPYVDPHDTMRVVIPATVSADGLTVTLSLDADATAAMRDREGAHSWDLYVRSDTDDWTRVLEGTLSVIVGDAR
jgi:hypothetical protein